MKGSEKEARGRRAMSETSVGALYAGLVKQIQRLKAAQTKVK